MPALRHPPTAVLSAEEFERRLLALMPRLRSAVARMVGERQSVDDVVQTSLLRAIEAAPRFDPDQSLASWLFGIARNVAREERRTRSCRPLDGEAGPTDPQDDERCDPVYCAARAEVAHLVAACIRSLPAMYRETLDAHLLGGESAAQIAARSAERIDTVKSRMRRGLDQLRRSLPRAMAALLAAQLAAAVQVRSTTVSAAAAGRPRRWLVRAGWGGAALALAGSLPLLFLSPPSGSTSRRAGLGTATDVAAVGPMQDVAQLPPPRTRLIPSPADGSIRGALVDAGGHPVELRAVDPPRLVLMRADVAVPAADALPEAPELRFAELLDRVDPGALLAKAADALAVGRAPPECAVAQVQAVGRFDMPMPRFDRGWIILDDDHLSLPAPVPWSLHAHGGDLGILPCFRGACLEGRVEAAMAGALVYLAADEADAMLDVVCMASMALHGGRMLTRIASDGSFRFRGVWPGARLSMWTSADGQFLAARVAATHAGETRSVTLLPERGAELELRVDDRGGPPPGAEAPLQVSVFDAGSPSPRPLVQMATEPVAPGVCRARLGVLPPGDYRVVVTAADGARAEVTERLRPGRQSTRLVLPGGFRMSGRVVNERGEPVAGAVVVAEAGPGTEPTLEGPAPGVVGHLDPATTCTRTTTDEEGRFRLRCALRPSRLSVEPPAGLRARSLAVAEVGHGAEITVRSTPVIHAALAAATAERARLIWRSGAVPGTPDATGLVLRVDRVALAALPADDSGRLLVATDPPPGARELQIEVEETRAGPLGAPPRVYRTGLVLDSDASACPDVPIELGVLQPQAVTRSLRVRCAVPPGRPPLQSVHVCWFREGLPLAVDGGAATAGGPEGDLEFTVPVESAVRLCARGEDANGQPIEGELRVGRCEDRVVLHLVPHGRIEGTAVGAVDLLWQPAAVAGSMEPLARAVHVAADGSFVCAGARPGRHRLVVLAADGRPLGSSVEVDVPADGGVVRCVLGAEQEPAGITIDVRVRALQRAEGALSVVVAAADSLEPPRAGSVDPSGRARIEVRPGEPCRLLLLDAAGVPLGAATSFTAEQVATGLVELEVPEIRIQGRVRGLPPASEDGHELAGYVQVTAADGRGPACVLPLDAVGRFVVRGLAPGCYRVTAILLDGGGAAGCVTVPVSGAVELALDWTPGGALTVVAGPVESGSGAMVTLSLDGVPLPGANALLDMAGRARFEGLPPGRFGVHRIDDLSVGPGGALGPMLAEVQIVAGADQVVRLPK